MSADPLDALRSEGDVNLSPRRRQWSAEHVGPEAQARLAEDSRHFLHQSLSTPCLNVLAKAQGAWIEDVEGRRYLDFHGNNVHQVGFSHPRVVQAIKDQLDTLSFCTRRYTCDPAIELARQRPALVVAALQPGTVQSALSWPFVGEAATPPLQAAAALLRALDGLQPTGRAQFVDHAGQAIPW